MKLKIYYSVVNNMVEFHTDPDAIDPGTDNEGELEIHELDGKWYIEIGNGMGQVEVEQ